MKTQKLYQVKVYVRESRKMDKYREMYIATENLDAAIAYAKQPELYSELPEWVSGINVYSCNYMGIVYV